MDEGHRRPNDPASRQVAAQQREPHPPVPTVRKQLLENRTTIFALLFGVTGFLGLPVLWLSPVFSRTEKWVWSVIVTIYTFALIAVTVAVLWWSYTRIRDALYF